MKKYHYSTKIFKNEDSYLRCISRSFTIYIASIIIKFSIKKYKHQGNENNEKEMHTCNLPQ